MVARVVIALSMSFTGVITVCRAQETRESETLAKAKAEFFNARAKAAAEYSASVADARGKFVAALKGEMEKATKDGKLDEAIRIRDVIKHHQSEGEQDILKRLRGTNWVNGNGATFQWQKDGLFYRGDACKDCLPLDSRSVLVVNWNKCFDVLVFDPEFKSFEHYNIVFKEPFQQGTPFTPKQ